jgi:hypothetical protein
MIILWHEGIQEIHFIDTFRPVFYSGGYSGTSKPE